MAHPRPLLLTGHEQRSAVGILGGLQLKQVLAEGGVVIEQPLLLLQHWLQALPELVFKQGRKFFEQRLHRLEFLAGLGEFLFQRLPAFLLLMP